MSPKAIEILPYRPSLSVSGSGGGQFFGGGSASVSIQMDAVKSTASSEGEQGQYGESLVYYHDDNQMITEHDVIESDISRFSRRINFYERDQEDIWKSMEMKYNPVSRDVILFNVPAKAIFKPLTAPLLPDQVRLRLGHMPEHVTINVSSLGKAVPLHMEFHPPPPMAKGSAAEEMEGSLPADDEDASSSIDSIRSQTDEE